MISKLPLPKKTVPRNIISRNSVRAMGAKSPSRRKAKKKIRVKLARL